ncbi:MAG: hypothetical protein SynsKO_18970 [Synoicihabitans sp.]
MICYAKTLLTCPGWDGSSCFTVKVPGIYHFVVSFTRDSQCPQGSIHPQGSENIALKPGQPCARCPEGNKATLGTNDDCQIRLTKNQNPFAIAYVGESSASRAGGSVAVNYKLDKNDVVSTSSWSVKDEFRRFREVTFSGHLIEAMDDA